MGYIQKEAWAKTGITVCFGVHRKPISLSVIPWNINPHGSIPFMKLHAILITAYFLLIQITQVTTAEIFIPSYFRAVKAKRAVDPGTLWSSGQRWSPSKLSAKTFCKRCLEGLPLLIPGPSHLKGIFLILSCMWQLSLLHLCSSRHSPSLSFRFSQHLLSYPHKHSHSCIQSMLIPVLSSVIVLSQGNGWGLTLGVSCFKFSWLLCLPRAPPLLLVPLQDSLLAIDKNNSLRKEFNLK